MISIGHWRGMSGCDETELCVKVESPSPKTRRSVTYNAETLKNSNIVWETARRKDIGSTSSGQFKLTSVFKIDLLGLLPSPVLLVSSIFYAVRVDRSSTVIGTE